MKEADVERFPKGGGNKDRKLKTEFCPKLKLLVTILAS